MRKRIAIVVSHPIQYYSPWFRYLAAQDGIEIKVFYLWDFGVTPQKDRGFGEVIQWDVPLLGGYAHEFIRNISRDPGTHHFWGLNNPSLGRGLKRWQPDAVLMYGYAYASHVRWLLSRASQRLPTLIRGDSHELSHGRGLRHRIKGMLRRQLFRRCAGALAVGTANANYFRSNGIHESAIFVAPHCVDNLWFQAQRSQATTAAAEWRRELGILPDSRLVLFAGKLEEKKRPQDLLRAFQIWQERHAERVEKATLLFVGSGHLSELLRQRVEGMNTRSVVFAPFQNQTSMPKVYAASDLFCLPSYGSGETWGLAVNEAMNFSKPIIVSSHVGCATDLVHPNKNGWVFQAGSLQSLVDVLDDALDDSAPLETMGEASFDLVQTFSYENATIGLMHAVNTIAHSRTDRNYSVL